MFNLDQAIAVWRNGMSTAGITSHDLLDELEAHLRDHIEQEIQSGADERQAYEAAVAQLGKITVLRDEFGKTKLKTTNRPIFLKACYVFFGLSMLLINFCTLLIYELSAAERIVGFSAVALVSLYLGILPYFLKSLRAEIYSQLTKLIKVLFCVFFLWPFWELLEAEHVVHSGMGLVSQMVLWSLYSAVVMTVIAVALYESGPRSGNGGGLPPLEPCPIPSPPKRPPHLDISISLPQAASFNSLAREALNAAAQEAARLGHDFIGTEHVLLGALKLAKGPFEQFLLKLQLDCVTVRLEIERLVPPVLARHEGADPPLTPRACKALRFAAKEAKKFHQPAIGLEHIFLGLLLENSGVAGRVLRSLGIGMKKARQEIVSSVGSLPRG